MARAQDLLDLIRRRGVGRIVAEHVQAESPGLHAPWPTWADEAIVAGYRARGIDQPWVHQVQAAQAAWDGKHVALVTGTGSGKSLGLWLPALTAIRTGRAAGLGAGATALYLSPTKALAADQARTVGKVVAGLTDVAIATCDGDTPHDVRGWVQAFAGAVFTNPDFLHFSLLPRHPKWRRLLRGLRYIIVDEAHHYRGLFGAHVANVLRRLVRLARHYGADPRFLTASATTADPLASARRLLSVDVEVIDEDASPHGRTHFVLWEPPVLSEPQVVEQLPPGVRAGAALAAPEDSPALVDDPWALALPAATKPLDTAPEPLAAATEPLAAVTDPADDAATELVNAVTDPADDETQPRPLAPVASARLSARGEVTRLLADLTAAGARTLAFARSRRLVEVIARGTRDLLAESGQHGAVAAYRGGYLPEERRALEDAIGSGKLSALATTNALELGMDIQGLDAVLLTGWPGTKASFWQQAGRAGRAGAHGVVVLVGGDNPLDTYLVNHPDAIFAENVEASVFDPANPWVLAPHLCAAAAELPLTLEDLASFDEPRPLLDQLTGAGYLRKRSGGWYWVAAGQPSALTDLRGSGGRPFNLVEESTGTVLGTVDASAADITVHPGAVYVHQGLTYLVRSLDHTDHVALVTPARVGYATFAYAASTISITHIDAQNRWGPVQWGLGDVEVTSQVTHFSRLRLPHLEVLDTQRLDMPERSFATRAVWWSVPAEELRAHGVAATLAPGALHAAEHAAIAMLPLLATCDRWDLGGISTALHPQTGAPTVFVHDAYPGGAGLADRGFDQALAWLRATRAAIAACECVQGCPSCIQSPKCGNGNSPLDKDGALVLLDLVLAHAPVTSDPGR